MQATVYAIFMNQVHVCVTVDRLYKLGQTKGTKNEQCMGNYQDSDSPQPTLLGTSAKFIYLSCDHYSGCVAILTLFTG